MWWIPALIGGVLGIAGKLTGRARRKQAVEQAIEQGARNLEEGKTISTQNAAQLAQDNLYVLGLSGVSANEGTASQLSQQVRLQNTATVNKMTRDYEDYVRNLRASDSADALNTTFSVLGDVFSTAGRLSYDNQRINASYTPEAPPILKSPGFDVSDQWITPLGQQRFGALTGPETPGPFKKY